MENNKSLKALHNNSGLIMHVQLKLLFFSSHSILYTQIHDLKLNNSNLESSADEVKESRNLITFLGNFLNIVFNRFLKRIFNENKRLD